MSISSLGAGLAPLTQAKPQPATQAPSRQIQLVRPPHHGHGGGKVPASTESANATSSSATGTTLNSLV